MNEIESDLSHVSGNTFNAGHNAALWMWAIINVVTGVLRRRIPTSTADSAKCLFHNLLATSAHKHSHSPGSPLAQRPSDSQCKTHRPPTYLILPDVFWIIAEYAAAGWLHAVQRDTVDGKCLAWDLVHHRARPELMAGPRTAALLSNGCALCGFSVDHHAG